MNYEEKYKKVLKSMRDLYNKMKYLSSTDALATTATLENTFPELRESEDERIRKEIINYFKCQSREEPSRKDIHNKWITWLEKVIIPSHNDIDSSFIEDIKNVITEAPLLMQSDKEKMIAWLEKQGEQKPTDKVEPKFKVGDWITNGGLLVGQVTSFDGEYYHYMCEGIEQPLHISNAYNWHLWTIQDAKDGDVLATKKGNPFIYDKDRYNNGLAYYYAGLDVNKELTLKSPHHMLAHFGELHSVSPATKEQRELLFQKMKEAGYEWNAEKKELRKIETSTWSEEDSKNLNSVKWIIENSENLNRVFETIDSPEYIKKYFIDWLKSLKDRFQLQPKQEWSEADEKVMKRIDSLLYSQCTIHGSEYEELHKWLKSLKPNHWKPSEEQMSMLLAVLNDSNNITSESVYIALKLLYNDLKKL